MKTLFLAALLTLTAAPATPATYAEIVATDARGNVWIAGSGDDCAAAWVGAFDHVPADWLELACVEYR